jgi:hypothetical protein
MSTKYKFGISSRKITSYLPDIQQELSIKVLEDEGDLTNFHFLLKFSKDSNALEIREIHLKIGVSWQDMETIAYLKGRFFFREERDINNALVELQNGLNAKSYCIDQFNARWQQFHLQFCEWFNIKFKPCQIKEIETHQSYLALNND